MGVPKQPLKALTFLGPCASQQTISRPSVQAMAHLGYIIEELSVVADWRHNFLDRIAVEGGHWLKTEYQEIEREAKTFLPEMSDQTKRWLLAYWFLVWIIIRFHGGIDRSIATGMFTERLRDKLLGREDRGVKAF